MPRNMTPEAERPLAILLENRDTVEQFYELVRAGELYQCTRSPAYVQENPLNVSQDRQARNSLKSLSA